MGATTPKTTRDKFYRELAANWLRSVMDNRGIKKTALAAALGVDRSVASRYLTKDVRPPLLRLMNLKRTINEDLPQEIQEAFWQLEDRTDDPVVGLPADVEAQIRDLGAKLTKEIDPRSKVAAKRELEALLKKLA